MRTVALVSMTALISALVSCAPPEEGFSLADDDEADWAARRARMNITVRVQDPMGDRDRELTPEEFREILRLECVTLRDSGVPVAPHVGCDQTEYTTLQPCQAATCAANLLLCMAHRARELAEIVQPTDLVTVVDGYAATVIPQDMASQAGLNELALQLAQESMGIAGENLRRGAGATADQTIAVCLPVDMKTVPLGGQGAPMMHGDSLAFDLAEARHLVEEAGNAAADANIAVADAEFSLRGDPGSAARDAWSAAYLSRLHAAELMVGGPPSPVARPLMGSAPLITSARFSSFEFLRNGHCASGPLSPADAAARAFIRNAATHPGPTFDPDVTFGELYLGTGTGPGLRDAIAQMTGLPEFAGVPGGAPPLGPEDFLEAYGLTEGNFLAARTRMREEYAAFGRDPTAQLPALALPPDPTTGASRTYVGRYVATGLPPVAPSASFYVRLARSHVGDVDDRDGVVIGAVRPGPTYARRSVAAAVDYAITTAYATLGDSDFSDQTTETLGEIVNGSIESRTARLESCYYRTASHRVRARLYTDIPAADLVLVEGSAGLACATRGNIEGAPCVLADHVVPGVTGTTAPVGRNYGFAQRVEYDLTELSSTEPVDYYVVRRRAGAPANGTGSYEDLAPLYFDSFVATPEIPGLQFCNALPVMPAAIAHVQSAVRTDEETCEEPEAPCGVLSDGRVPLENELIDDGNGFESSWRYHLDRARAAAAHADQLAEEMIESGFEIERRADAANEELLRACGVTVSLDGLFGEDGGPSVTAGACPGGTTNGITIGGRCVRTAVRTTATDGATDRDARVLAECLGDDAVVPLVSLGTNQLCVWRRVGDPGLICEGASATNRCPYLADAAGSCAPRSPTSPPSGVTFESVAVADHLGFFGLDEGASALAVVRPDCNLVRDLRTPGSDTPRSAARDDRLREILDTNFFYVGNVAAGFQPEGTTSGLRFSA